MPARKKPAAKKAKTQLRAAAPAAPKSPLTIPAQLVRIERMVRRTLNVVEFLEGEIIKARDANSVDMAKKIEATPYDEAT
jgi:hypothetical protein